MKQNDIAALLDELACGHNQKAKSGCAKPKPGATAGGCAFDGAQIALLPNFAYAGYEGMLELARQLCLSIESPVWEAVRRPAPWAVGSAVRTEWMGGLGEGSHTGPDGEVAYG